MKDILHRVKVSFSIASNLIIKLQDENAQLKCALLENEYIQEKGFKFNEQDMIDFAEYVASYSDKNRNIHNQMLHAKSKYDGAERTIDLLEIWLKELKKNNMDSKQKAKELIETFTFNCRECDNAKLSALFAVDEILDLDTGDSLNKNYWEEVRQELLAT